MQVCVNVSTQTMYMTKPSIVREGSKEGKISEM